MLNMSFIVILGIIGMYACYKPVCGYLRQAGKAPGSRESAGTVQDKDKSIGFSVFMVIFAAALLARLVIAVVHRGYETDINCFIPCHSMI